ncbi:MAG: hypothetical protein ACYSWP_22770, partial [Planctomycetota bacterium]
MKRTTNNQLSIINNQWKGEPNFKISRIVHREYAKRTQFLIHSSTHLPIYTKMQNEPKLIYKETSPTGDSKSVSLGL